MKKSTIIVSLAAILSLTVVTQAVIKNKGSRRSVSASLYPTAPAVAALKQRQLRLTASWRKKYGHVHPKIKFTSVKQTGYSLETRLTVLSPFDEGDVDATMGAVQLFVDKRVVARSVAADTTGGKNWGVLQFTFLVDGSALKLRSGTHKVSAFDRDTGEWVSQKFNWK